jgi:hypothetical protein
VQGINNINLLSFRIIIVRSLPGEVVIKGAFEKINFKNDAAKGDEANHCGITGCLRSHF